MSTAPSGRAIHTSQSISGVDRRLVTWRRRLERRRRVSETALHVPGAERAYVITHPADPDAVLDELDSPEPHMPYWATLWPSGLALAEVALARGEVLKVKKVLELGCGLGTTATALAECGASVSGADCFAEALAFARYNVTRNTGNELRPLRLDWRTDAGRRQLGELPADMMVAADVLYEADDMQPLLELGEHMLRRGTAFWLAEPGRATSSRFVEQASAYGWRSETVVIEREWPAVVGSATVRVHLFDPH
jgi:predicted nicotinamide N-methyase